MVDFLSHINIVRFIPKLYFNPKLRAEAILNLILKYLMAKMNAVIQNFVKIMYHISIFNLIIPDTKLLFISIQPLVVILHFQKHIILFAKLFLFGQRNCVYGYNTLFDYQRFKFQHLVVYFHFSSKSNMATGSHLDFEPKNQMLCQK